VSVMHSVSGRQQSGKASAQVANKSEGRARAGAAPLTHLIGHFPLCLLMRLPGPVCLILRWREDSSSVCRRGSQRHNRRMRRAARPIGIWRGHSAFSHCARVGLGGHTTRVESRDNRASSDQQADVDMRW